MAKEPTFRNAAKQTYAEKFLAWVRSGERGTEPSRGKLSAMAAQSVRHAVYEWARTNGISFHA